jgi:hypothetical protein
MQPTPEHARGAFPDAGEICFKAGEWGSCAMPIALRTDYDGCESKDANLTRRIIRDWVLRFNARGPHGWRRQAHAFEASIYASDRS